MMIADGGSSGGGGEEGRAGVEKSRKGDASEFPAMCFLYTCGSALLQRRSICAMTVNDHVISRSPICDRTPRYLSNEEPERHAA